MKAAWATGLLRASSISRCTRCATGDGSFGAASFGKRSLKKLLYYGPEAREAVWNLRRRGLSLRAIAARTGVSVSTCCVWIRRKEAELKAEAEATAEKIREKALMMDPVE